MSIHLDELIYAEEKHGGFRIMDCDGDHLCYIPLSLAPDEAHAVALMRWVAPLLNRAEEHGKAIGARDAKLAVRRALEL